MAGRLWVPGQPEGRASVIRPCFRKTKKWAVVTRHGVLAQPTVLPSLYMHRLLRQCLVSIEVAPWPWVGLQESGQSCHLKWWEYYKHNLVERELWKEKETRRNSFVLLLEEREVECALMPLLYASPVAPHLTCSRFQLCLVLSMWRTWDIEIIMQTYLCSWSWEAYRSGPFPWALGLFPNALLHPWEATQSQLFSFPPYCIALLLKAQRLKADYPGTFSSGSL